MSSISTSQILTDKVPFAGKKWYYRFRELPSVFSQEECASVVTSLQDRYAALTKKWSSETNSEWTCRLYMAAKLVMSATIHVNSADYAEQRNLRVVIPYLRYYAVFSLLRAICYTIPEQMWNAGKLLHISHATAINVTQDHLYRFNKAVSEVVGDQIRELKAERELLSYGAPSSGDDHISEKNRFLSLCGMLAEVAQFDSEVIESSLLKHGDPTTFVLLKNYLESITNLIIEGHYFGDKEDAYRLNYLTRKHPRPTNILHMMTEGHVDDFFGAWVNYDEKSGSFNPDEMKEIIFDIP